MCTLFALMVFLPSRLAAYGFGLIFLAGAAMGLISGEILGISTSVNISYKVSRARQPLMFWISVAYFVAVGLYLLREFHRQRPKSPNLLSHTDARVPATRASDIDASAAERER